MAYRDYERRKKPTVGSIVAVLLALAFMSEDSEWLYFLVGMAMLILPFYIAFRIAKAAKQKKSQPRENSDQCPQTICFHRDKGEHHVRQGREMDPWDRPDIDISKYQRR